MRKPIYTMIERFMIKAHCTAPMHVGSGISETGDILLDDESNQPYIPATGLSGVFRSYYEKKYSEAATDKLFGTITDIELPDSLIKFSDGRFLTSTGTVKIEVRPRLALDPASGTGSSSKTQGEGISSGHKFEMQYVGAGAEFEFEIVIRSETEYVKELTECFSEINAGGIQFGGQKSNGCGEICIDSVSYSRYDMKERQARIAWEENKPYEEKNLVIDKKTSSIIAYSIMLNGKTDGELLVKAISTRNYDKDSPDSENMRNSRDEYIIPGSSIKGAVRNRMNMIRTYLGLPEKVIHHAFGRAEDKDNFGQTGNISFRDIVVGYISSNNNAPIRSRIHIDKFLGSVVNGSLFSEKNVHGILNIKIQIRKDRFCDETLALLMFALRDLASEVFSIGSGYNVGKGFIKPENIQVKTADGKELFIEYDSSGEAVIRDPDNIISKAMDSLKQLKQEA